MSITIKDYYEGLEQFEKEKQAEIDKLINELESLKQDSNVMRYIDIEKTLNILNGTFIFTNTYENVHPRNVEREYKSIPKDCSHDFWVLETDLVTLHTLDMYAECLTCGHIVDEHELDLETLFHKKRLIAEKASSEDMRLYDTDQDYVPIMGISANMVRDYYYELFMNEEIDIEDKVWDYFCQERSKVKTIKQ